MGAEYELYLEDDAGNRLLLLKDLFFLSYSRTVVGMGTFNCGLSLRSFSKSVNPVFAPDRRITVWRSPASGIPPRREGTFLLREFRVYTRESDNMDVIQFYGRSGLDLLRRREVIQPASTAYASKTDFIDDMMKAVVREQMLYGSAVDYNGASDNARAYPNGEFFVDADLSLGPSVTKTFQDRNVLDVLKELKDASFALNKENGSEKIYFDVVESQIENTTRFGWAFRTYAGLRGTDRSNGIEFSIENENLAVPAYSRSHFDEVNSVFTKNQTVMVNVKSADRIAASRWNVCESSRFGYSDSTAAGITAIGNAELGKGAPAEELNAIFLNTPGTSRAPRSLYGIDWDMGDLLPVSYAGMQFDAEVKIVYVSINDQGQETLSGRSIVG